jgi:hypothetical protein
VEPAAAASAGTEGFAAVAAAAAGDEAGVDAAVDGDADMAEAAPEFVYITDYT